VQQASNITSLLAEFRRDGTLSAAYFDLVYSFDDATFERVKATAAAEVQRLVLAYPGRKWNEVIQLERPTCDCLKAQQGARKEGGQLYWPHLFAFSEEERRLDSLLDYFNSIGFYYHEGLIEMDDIARIIGDYVAVIGTRKIMGEYFRYCGSRPPERVKGAPTTFHNQSKQKKKAAALDSNFTEIEASVHP
jgi:hypothetical protein